MRLMSCGHLRLLIMSLLMSLYRQTSHLVCFKGGDHGEEVIECEVAWEGALAVLWATSAGSIRSHGQPSTLPMLTKGVAQVAVVAR